MTTVRFAAIPMNSGDDVSANCRAVSRLLDQASADGAKLAVLPENFAAMSSNEAVRVRIAEVDGSGPIQSTLADAAARNGMWVVGGTIPIRSEDPARPFASCCIYDEHGDRVGRYDKIHLFDVGIPGGDETYRESANTEAGAQDLVLATPWGRLGIGVCYDLRFPELFRRMCSKGMDFLALPAAFTVSTGIVHWQSLVLARAIENLCYVVTAAQTGSHPGGRRTYGHSMIVDPWGDIMKDSGESTKIISAPVDFDRLAELRRKFPVLAHRRLNDASTDNALMDLQQVRGIGKQESSDFD